MYPELENRKTAAVLAPVRLDPAAVVAAEQAVEPVQVQVQAPDLVRDLG